MYINRLKKSILILLMGLSFGSCESFFDKTPDDMLTNDDHYTDKTNIYAAFMGLFGQLQDVADDYIIVSELMGDLLTPTIQAPDKYWDVFRYEPRQDNPIINPAPYYNIVMNCNDFMRNTVDYNKKYPKVIPKATYRQLIAGAISLRTWAYLTIGKLYGEAVYFDYSMGGSVDLTTLPVMDFDRLIDELIHFMNVGVDDISAFYRVDMDLMFGVEGWAWRRMAMQPDILMCELYLWDKNYAMAAKKGLNLMTDQGLIGSSTSDRLTCSYKFGHGTGGGNQKPWHTLWSVDPINEHADEGLTFVLYSYNNKQTHELQKMFSNTPPNLYYLKPMQSLLDKFTTDEYLNANGVLVNDPRGQGTTYGTELGENVVVKYHKNREYYKHDGTIYLYRAGELHLMVAEALTALGHYDAADQIINVGFGPSWVQGNIFNPPFDAPIYRFGKLKAGRGVRGRVLAPSIFSTEKRFMGELDSGTPEYDDRRHFVLDSLIMEETARELAFEGKRWFTMIRIARNTNNPEFLAMPASRKFPVAQRQEYHDMLMNEQNWFIKYDLKLDK